jgi:hypothetical protein
VERRPIDRNAKNRASTHAVGIRRGDKLAGSGDNAVPFFKTQMNLGGTNLDYGAAIRVFNSLRLSLAMASPILRFGKTDKLSIFAIRCFRMRCDPIYVKRPVFLEKRHLFGIQLEHGDIVLLRAPKGSGQRLVLVRGINRKARSSPVDHVLGGAEKNLARNVDQDSTAKQLSVVTIIGSENRRDTTSQRFNRLGWPGFNDRDRWGTTDRKQ